jgi:hypothetical protein
VPAAPQSTTATLQDRALDDLRFIRDTMASTSSFTAISGLGFAIVGLSAIVTGAVSHAFDVPLHRVLAWAGDAVFAVIVGLTTTAMKARKAGQELLSRPFRKFALGLAPAILAGGVLTIVLLQHGEYDLLPGLWLLLYGVGLAAGGAYSVSSVPIMGAAFMTLGVLAAFTPQWGRWWMLAGFGVLHMLFGAVLMRRHGG